MDGGGIGLEFVYFGINVLRRGILRIWVLSGGRYRILEFLFSF